MKISKQLVEENIVGKWKVPSKSEKGQYHIVEKLKNGEYICDCIAGGFKRDCKHLKIIKDYESRILSKR